jgi:imidazolonepropionase-like amidohydrolase
LQVGVNLLIEGGRIASVSPEESDPGDADVLDGGGATIVPAFVDAHSHLTMPGGSHWIERGSDPPDRLREVARRNATRLVQAGILWARDVGSPAGPDGRAVSLEVRQEMADRAGAPYIRVAGTWIATDGYLPMTVPVKDGDGLRAAALAQLDSGTDVVKIMLDPPDRSDRCPFTVDDVRKACEAVHGRGRKITAHATILDGARVGAEAGVDSIEHGMELDDAIAATMRANNVALVSTLSVLASWATFERTTRIERFTSDEGRRRLAARREGALTAIKAAHGAGVRIAAGSDFGGGSVRAGHLAWEVEQLVEAGLEPHQALAAVTWQGGELLGVDHAGRIRPGDPADLVLIHGDPLTDPRALWRVWAVFKGGERVA